MQINVMEGRSKAGRKLKVCAYCRVSTDADEQENSLENQMMTWKQIYQNITKVRMGFIMRTI